MANTKIEKAVAEAKARISATEAILRKLEEAKQMYTDYDIDEETGEAINERPYDCWSNEGTGKMVWQMVDEITDKLMKAIS